MNTYENHILKNRVVLGKLLENSHCLITITFNKKFPVSVFTLVK